MREHRPVIALDFPSFEAVKEFLALFPAEESLYLKVGMELYYAVGPEIVSYLKGLGHSVFLDLKLHDIPNTVKSAMKVLSQLGVDMTNVHAAGGVEMMKAAREGLGSQAKLIAVTQLTSTSEAQMQEFQNIQTSLQESVIHYAKKTAEAGLMVLFARLRKYKSSSRLPIQILSVWHQGFVQLVLQLEIKNESWHLLMPIKSAVTIS